MWQAWHSTAQELMTFVSSYWLTKTDWHTQTDDKLKEKSTAILLCRQSMHSPTCQECSDRWLIRVWRISVHHYLWFLLRGFMGRNPTKISLFAHHCLAVEFWATWGMVASFLTLDAVLMLEHCLQMCIVYYKPYLLMSFPWIWMQI